MVDIPGGSFTMGEPRTGPDYDQMKPAHKVTVPPFYMGKFEVTQAQWRAVANLRKVSRDLQPSPSHFKGANLPVDSVSWNDAMEFCARLSRATGRAYRLPTEAEWEYACRGGTTTPYSFGETLTPWVVNFDGRFSTGSAPAGVFRRKTTPVGSMEVASGFGVFDMDGNVREWCMDYWHENYKGAPADGSAWRTGGAPDSRVTRGGSWDLPGHMCGAAERNFCSPDSCRLEVFGFRVVMDVRTR
jgi:formylglycine-generating enzyme required for sulfatase activity